MKQIRMEDRLFRLGVQLGVAIEALEQIADPRKRDHKEPDTYTELGCVMNIADIALQLIKEEELISEVLKTDEIPPRF